jgi:sugar phosphate permease
MMKSKRLFYGWIMVAITALVIILAAGVRSAPGVFLVPMGSDTGWSKATISTAIAIGLVMFGLGAPLSGYLMDRSGPRRMALIGLVLMGLGMIPSAYLSQVWQLNLLWGLVAGLGTGLIGGVIGAAVANRWFIEQRGLVVGIFGASTSAGQLIFIPLLNAWAVGMGWREASLWVGVAALICLIPAWLLLKDDPADVGARPLGAKPDAPIIRPTPEAGVMKRAVRRLDFWLLAGTFFVCGLSSNGLVGVHFIPYAVDCGLTTTAAAGILAVMGAFNFVGTIASGWLTDRYDPRKLLCIYYGFRGVSLLFLPYVNEPLGLSAFAILFGLDYIATVPPTIALTVDTFGRRNVGTVYGWVFCAHQMGAALASSLGGVARDSLGNYTLAFILGGAIAIGAGLLSLGIRRGPQQVQPAAA